MTFELKMLTTAFGPKRTLDFWSPLSLNPYQDKWQELASTIVSPMSSPDTLAPHVDKWLTPRDSTKTTEVLIAEIRNEYNLNIATEAGFDSKIKNQAVVGEIKVRFVEK